MEPGFEWIVRHEYGALFVLLMLGIVGLPVPDETLLVFAGYLSFKGTLQFEPAVATAFLGSACGISLSYALGRFVGLPALIKFGPLIHLRPEHLAHVHRWVERWGEIFPAPGLFHSGIPPSCCIGDGRLTPSANGVCSLRLCRGAALVGKLHRTRLYRRRKVAAAYSAPA
jgi:membrane protein YqaA with SNARE-associated domain